MELASGRCPNPPAASLRYVRRFQNWPQKNAEITKRLEFSVFFAFSCGDAGVLKIPHVAQPSWLRVQVASSHQFQEHSQDASLHLDLEIEPLFIIPECQLIYFVVARQKNGRPAGTRNRHAHGDGARPGLVSGGRFLPARTRRLNWREQPATTQQPGGAEGLLRARLVAGSVLVWMSSFHNHTFTMGFGSQKTKPLEKSGQIIRRENTRELWGEHPIDILLNPKAGAANLIIFDTPAKWGDGCRYDYHQPSHS